MRTRRRLAPYRTVPLTRALSCFSSDPRSVGSGFSRPGPPEGGPTHFDKAGLIERVAGIAGGQRLIVQGERRFAADDAAVALEEFEPNDAAHPLLHFRDV